MDSLFLRRPLSTFHAELQPLPSGRASASPSYFQQKYYWLVALLVMTAVRFVMAWVIPISPEEAYHWNFARHLDWSYYDHPPMLAWAIALGRLILGDTELGVRLLPVMFSIGTAVLLAGLARRFYGDLGAAWTVVLLALNPCVLVIGGWGFPDAPLLFFWSLTLVLVWRSLETGQGMWWLGAGAALGAAMLSKYTAAFLVPSLFCYLIFSRQHRHWLATPWPYLGGVASLLVFSPVFYWNWAHDWVSFRFQSTARLSAANDFSWRAGGVFLGEQWLAILPLTLPLGIAALWQALKCRRADERFLFWLFLPMIAFFWAFGFTPSYHVLWALPAYLSLTVLMAGAVVRQETLIARFYRNWIRGIVAVAVCVLVLGVTHAAWVIPGISPLRETYGWEEIAARAKAERDTLLASRAALAPGATSGPKSIEDRRSRIENGDSFDPPFSILDPQFSILNPESSPGVFFLAIGNRSYPCPSQLAFHLNDPENVHGSSLLGIRNLQYQFWSDPEKLRGQDAVIVLESGTGNPWTLTILAKHFQSIEPAGDIILSIGKLPFGPKRQRRFFFYRARGYRGLQEDTNP